MRVKELFDFIHERHNIYTRRFETGDPKPWTQDPILQRYRFCNVYRELDTVTLWIANNWRAMNEDDPYVWFAMTVARLLNLPASMYAIDYPVPWKPTNFKRILANRKAAGERVFSGAYMIHADATETGRKTDYLADFVLTPLWKARGTFSGIKTLGEFHRHLMTFRDMGSFMAGQVVADTKFTNLLFTAPDWWTFVARGPGSERGLNRVFNEDPTLHLREELWQADFKIIQAKINPLIKSAGMPRLSAQDLQNCLCEFDKYSRALNGEGRPKQLYPGAA